MRPQPLQDFLDAAHTAFLAKARDPDATASLSRIFAALESPGMVSDTPGGRLPTCTYLGQAADPQKFDDPLLARLVQTFLSLEPNLKWGPRKGDCTNAGPGFAENHANALIFGPGGYERRTDVWLGVSLIAPKIRYPDHSHPPEETYLVLSPGRFMQGADNWSEPGTGGTLYNSPGILHAMRSDASPLFAFWALWADPHKG